MSLLTALILLTVLFAAFFVGAIGYVLSVLAEPVLPEPPVETEFDEGLIRWTDMLNQTRKDA